MQHTLSPGVPPTRPPTPKRRRKLQDTEGSRLSGPHRTGPRLPKLVSISTQVAAKQFSTTES